MQRQPEKRCVQEVTKRRRRRKSKRMVRIRRRRRAVTSRDSCVRQVLGVCLASLCWEGAQAEKRERREGTEKRREMME